MKLTRRTFLQSSGSALMAGDSKRLRSIEVGRAIRTPNKVDTGDTWVAAWADDDHLYSPADDTSLFDNPCKPWTGNECNANANVAFNRISVNANLSHCSGVTVNRMAEYGIENQKGPDGCTWKSSGCIWLDGAIYLIVARHNYGDDAGDPYRRQTAQNASIIKSVDYGKTWTRPARQNYDTPMFPGRRFATPYFIQYGYGHLPVTADNAGRYIYATANNGFWDSGDNTILGRVPREKMADLRGADWEFYIGGDGRSPRAWSANMADGRHIIESPRKLGMTGAVYLHHQRRYLMINWFYPAGGGALPNAFTHTVWDFYDSPKPWGPWRKLNTYTSSPAGWYSPQICPEFQERDSVIALTAGNPRSNADYRLTAVELKIVV